MTQRPLPEGFDRLVEASRGLKEEKVAKAEDLSPGGDAELLSTLFFHRGGREVASIFLPPNRDAMLQAAMIAVPSYGADELTMIHEVYGSDNFVKAMGRRADPGELQELFVAGRTDLVYEQLVLQRIRRDHERIDTVLLPYDLDRSARKVSWREPDMPDGVGGRITETLRAAFAKSTMHDEVISRIPPPPGMSPEVAQFHEDMAATKILAMAGFVVALATTEDWQREIMERSVEEGSLALLDEEGSVLAQGSGDPTLLGGLGAELRKRLARERGESWVADHRVGEQNRAERRRAEAARRKGS